MGEERLSSLTLIYTYYRSHKINLKETEIVFHCILVEPEEGCERR